MNNIENTSINDVNNKNKISITVKYVAGNFVDEFNIHQTIEHVFNKAIKALHIDASVASNLGLFLNGTLLNKSDRIQNLSMEDGVILILSSIGSSDVEGQ